MNILNLATTDENAAGVACRNVNDMFLRAGHQSVLLVRDSVSGYPGVVAVNKIKYGREDRSLKGRILNRLKSYYNRLNPLEKDDKYSFHNINEGKKQVAAQQLLDLVPFRPDAILVFWVSDFVNTALVAELAALTGARIMWMMTDNAPLTGGCHYQWDCEGYTKDCTNCPAILTAGKKGLAARNLSLKMKHITPDAIIMSSSESDFQRAKASTLFRDKRVYKLLAPIDEERFKPGNKQVAKAAFEIPSDKKVIFYGANAFSDPRKGASSFLNALKMLKEMLEQPGSQLRLNDIVLLLAGREKPDPFIHEGYIVKAVGYLNEAQLITAYNAADFLVSPSVEDSGPMMLNQSIVCGTPMLAFNTGVAMDLIETGVTGYKARLFDEHDLALGLHYLLGLSNEELDKMASNCRKFALENMTYAIYTRKLLETLK